MVKERVVKRYRHPTLEASLSKRRLNQEARCILRTRKNGVAAPCIYHIDYESARIYMSYIVGTTLKDWLLGLPAATAIDSQLKAVGQSLAGLHDADVVHGDLTSSNIMVSRSPGTHRADRQPANRKCLKHLKLDVQALAFDTGCAGARERGRRGKLFDH